MENVKTINLRRTEPRSVFIVISISLFLFPSFFSAFSTYIYRNNVNMYIVQAVSFIIGLLAISSKFKLKLISGEIGIKTLYVCLFLIQLINNGDIRNSLSNYVILSGITFLFVIFIISHSSLAVESIMKPILAFSAIHLIAGFYFYLNPSSMRFIAYNYFNLTERTRSLLEIGLTGGWFFTLTDQLTLSGVYMAIAVIASFCIVLSKYIQHKKFPIWVIAFLVMSFAGLALTGKRAHFVFAILSLIIIYLVSYAGNDRRAVIIRVFVGALIAFVCYFIFIRISAFQAIILRLELFGSLGDTSTNIRQGYWETALSMFRENPLFGIGWRQFRYLASSVNGNDVHNVYLQLLAETGIIGFTLYITFFVIHYVRTVKIINRRTDEISVQTYLPVLFSLGYQTFFLLYCFTGNPLYDIQLNTLYFICCGITQYYWHKYRAISE